MVRVAGTQVGLSLGGVVTVSNGTALILVTTDGLAGRISGTVAIAVPGVSLSGDLAVELNTTQGEVSETFIVAGVPTLLELPDGPFVQVAGTDLALTVLGQTLTGDLTLTRSNDAAGRPVVRIVAENLALVLGSGATTATFTQTGTDPAVIVVSADGVVANIEMSVALSVPGLAFDGDLGLELDTAAGYLKVTGTDIELDVLGQTLSADVTVEQVVGPTGKVVRVGLANVALDLAGVATLSDGTGLLVLTAGGVAAELSARLELDSDSPLSLSGRFSLALNTTGVAVSQTLPVGTGSVSLDLPAGPYLRLSGTGIVAEIAGQSLSGDVTLERAGGVVHVTASNVRMQLGDGTRALVRLTNGAADLTLGTAISGTVSGDVELVNVPSVGLSGSFTAFFDTAATTTSRIVVTGTNVVLTVAGQTLTAGEISFSKGSRPGHGRDRGRRAGLHRRRRELPRPRHRHRRRAQPDQRHRRRQRRVRRHLRHRRGRRTRRPFVGDLRSS